LVKRKILHKAWLLVVVLLVASFTLTACPEDTPDPGPGPGPGPGPVDDNRDIKNPDTFIIGTIGTIDSLDPAYAYDTRSGEQIQSIYETLILYDGESITEYVGVLADEWTISEDGMTYRFHIREGVTFHNGNTLTPSDVVYSFHRGMVQDYGAGPQWMIFESLFGGAYYSSRDIDPLMPLDVLMAPVVDTGDGWVQFNLPMPFEPFMQVITQTWACIVDEQWSIEQGDWDGTQASYEALNDPDSGASPLNSVTNGTGAFSLEHWQPAIEISLLRFDDYWGDAPAMERIITKMIDEWTTRKLELIAGDLDYAYVPRQYIGELEGIDTLLVYQDLPTMTNDSFFFQFDISPESTMVGSGQMDGAGIPLDFFTDLDVRMGFNYAFDWDTYIDDAMLGELTQRGSALIEGNSFFDPDAPAYSLDLALAEEHLRAAWGGAVWENGFTITLAYNSGNDTRKIACEILQANLFALNEDFRVNIQVMQWSSLLRGMYSQLLPMFQIGWAADYPDAHNFVFPYMHSQGTFSGWQNYNNPEADALIEAGIASLDPVEREAIYRALDVLYHADAPGIMIGQAVGRRYFQDWVTGYIFNPTNPSSVGHFKFLNKEYE
jgi:peptide/nickel transport system substrate-binding protein